MRLSVTQVVGHPFSLKRSRSFVQGGVDGGYPASRCGRCSGRPRPATCRGRGAVHFQNAQYLGCWRIQSRCDHGLVFRPNGPQPYPTSLEEGSCTCSLHACLYQSAQLNVIFPLLEELRNPKKERCKPLSGGFFFCKNQPKFPVAAI